MINIDDFLTAFQRVPESEWVAGLILLVFDTLLIVILLPMVLGFIRKHQWRPAQRQVAKTTYESIGVVFMMARSIRIGFEVALEREPALNPKINEHAPLGVSNILQAVDADAKILNINTIVSETIKGFIIT